jgi:hypothetical protein
MKTRKPGHERSACLKSGVVYDAPATYILKEEPSMCFKTLSLAAALALASSVTAARAQDSSAAAEPAFRLENYAQVLGALTSGRNVALTVNFSQCTLASTGASGPVVTGGLHIGSYLVPGNQYIAFADVHETLSPQNERVTEYIRYRVTPDGNVDIRTTTVRLSDGTLSNVAEYACAIGKGVNFNWHSH